MYLIEIESLAPPYHPQSYAGQHADRPWPAGRPGQVQGLRRQQGRGFGSPPLRGHHNRRLKQVRGPAASFGASCCLFLSI